MRVAIVSRIFEPEPAAASFRLSALAEALARLGHEVTVLTVYPPAAIVDAADDGSRPYRMKRFPVLRDRSGYVRGYLQYMSFDIPAFFRVLLGPKYDLVVVEPPPTTGFFVRIATTLRRIPYAYYAADIWADAAESTNAGALVVRAVRAVERLALSGASAVLSVNEGVTARIRVLAPEARVHTIGNGVDTTIFNRVGEARVGGQYVIYTGTASEWQGADVFIRAMVLLREKAPDLRLVFLGQGTAWSELQQLAHSLEAAVDFVDAVPPAEAAVWLRGAIASLASIRPESGYDVAFPTKLFASWGAGTPAVFAGVGQVREVMETCPSLGLAVDHDPVEVADAVLQIVRDPRFDKKTIADWAQRNVSLAGVAERAVSALVASQTDSRVS